MTNPDRMQRLYVCAAVALATGTGASCAGDRPHDRVAAPPSVVTHDASLSPQEAQANADQGGQPTVSLSDAPPLQVRRASDAPSACWDEPRQLLEQHYDERHAVVTIVRSVLATVAAAGSNDEVFPFLTTIRNLRIEDGHSVYVVSPVEIDNRELPAGLHAAQSTYPAVAEAFDRGKSVIVVHLRVDSAVNHVDAVRLEYAIYSPRDQRVSEKLGITYLGHVCVIKDDSGAFTLYWETVLSS